MRILFLNSGGKDARLTLNILRQQNPYTFIQSLTIETADLESMAAAAALAEEFGIPHFVLPFEATRQHIAGHLNTIGATQYWAFEFHFKGIQYATAKGFDFVASGHRDIDDFANIEQMLANIMNWTKIGHKVGFLS